MKLALHQLMHCKCGEKNLWHLWNLENWLSGYVMKIKSQLGIFQRLLGNLKVLFIFSANLRKLGHVKPKKPPGRSGKTTARKDRWIGNESKKDRFATATAISKRANANLGIRISKRTIPQRLNEVNLNCLVGSTKPYISRKNKMNQLKFVTEHVTWTEDQWDCVHFINESKFKLFSCDGRRFIWCSSKEWY